jgi:hypothetical protein
MTTPKLSVEQVFDRFTEFANKLFDDVAEPRSLVLVVDWQIGQNDFPAGLLITREKQIMPNDLLDVSKQLAKMNIRVLQIHTNALDGLAETVATVEDDIRKKQALLHELQEEIQKLAGNRRESNSPADTATSGTER